MHANALAAYRLDIARLGELATDVYAYVAEDGRVIMTELCLTKDVVPRPGKDHARLMRYWQHSREVMQDALVSEDAALQRDLELCRARLTAGNAVVAALQEQAGAAKEEGERDFVAFRIQTMEGELRALQEEERRLAAIASQAGGLGRYESTLIQLVDMQAPGTAVQRDAPRLIMAPSYEGQVLRIHDAFYRPDKLREVARVEVAVIAGDPTHERHEEAVQSLAKLSDHTLDPLDAVYESLPWMPQALKAASLVLINCYQRFGSLSRPRKMCLLRTLDLLDDLKPIKSACIAGALTAFAATDTGEDATAVVVTEAMVSTVDRIIREDKTYAQLKEQHFKVFMFCALLGLDVIHSLGYLHGGITNRCLFVDASSRARVGAFEFVQELGQPIHPNMDADMPYAVLVPELLFGTAAVFSDKMDVYALGVAMYEQLLRQTLYNGAKTPHAAMKVAFDFYGEPPAAMFGDGAAQHRRVRRMFSQHRAASKQSSAPAYCALRDEIGSKASDAGVAFLARLLAMDPMQRPTAREAIDDPWFDSVRRSAKGDPYVSEVKKRMAATLQRRGDMTVADMQAAINAATATSLDELGLDEKVQHSHLDILDYHEDTLDSAEGFVTTLHKKLRACAREDDASIRQHDAGRATRRTTLLKAADAALLSLVAPLKGCRAVDCLYDPAMAARVMKHGRVDMEERARRIRQRFIRKSWLKEDAAQGAK